MFTAELISRILEQITNADAGKWIYARQLKTPPKSAQEKREYTNMYTWKVGV